MAERQIVRGARARPRAGGVAGGGSPPPLTTAIDDMALPAADPSRPEWARLDAALAAVDPRLRLARPADGPGLARLVRELAATQWEEPRDPAPSFLRFLAAPRCGLPLIAVEGGAAQALCLLQHMPLPLDDGDQLCIDDLYVLRAARRRGLASLLLRGVDALAVALGVRYAYLHVQPEKVRAQAVYARAGFVAVDSRLMDKLYSAADDGAAR